MKSLLRTLSFYSSAELTVWSFVIMSLIGGAVLYITESRRVVHAPIAAHAEFQLISQAGMSDIEEPLPVSQIHTVIKKVSYTGERFIDTWFTAVSALCVTGLTSTDFSHFTLLGQVITMVLIQMGGLGIIVFTSIIALAVYRGLSERTTFRATMGGLLDSESHDVTDMLRFVIFYTFGFETLATVIMGAHLSSLADKSVLMGNNPWWFALFHSISAFNNSGFGLLPSNLVPFVTDPIINHTIGSLIILGGLGYPVLIYFYYVVRSIVSGNTEKQRQLKQISGVASPVQLRIAIWGTIVLLVSGTFIPLIIDWNNPVLAPLTPGQKVMAAYFQSVSTRTAGFNTIDIGALHVATVFLYIILMYIGTNPAGTGGGIKIPTVGVLYGYIKDWFRAPGQPVELFHRRISKFALSHAIRLLFSSLLLICAITFLIALFEKEFLITPDPTFNFLKVIFEIVSAYGTVGLTMGFPGSVSSFSTILTPASKFLLIVAMLAGRIGPLTMLAALPWKRTHENAPLSPDFPDVQKIQIG